MPTMTQVTKLETVSNSSNQALELLPEGTDNLVKRQLFSPHQAPSSPAKRRPASSHAAASEPRYSPPALPNHGLKKSSSFLTALIDELVIRKQGRMLRRPARYEISRHMYDHTCMHIEEGCTCYVCFCIRDAYESSKHNWFFCSREAESCSLCRKIIDACMEDIEELLKFQMTL